MLTIAPIPTIFILIETTLNLCMKECELDPMDTISYFLIIVTTMSETSTIATIVFDDPKIFSDVYDLETKNIAFSINNTPKKIMKNWFLKLSNI